MSFILDRNLYVPAIDAWIDPVAPKPRAIITHGHADHARSGHGAVLATPETIAIMQVRYGDDCAGRFEPLRFGEVLTIDGGFTAQITFHEVITVDHFTDLQDFRIIEVGDTAFRCDGNLLADLLRLGRANAVDIAKRDFYALIRRNIDAGNTGHFPSPKSERHSRTNQWATFRSPHELARFAKGAIYSQRCRPVNGVATGVCHFSSSAAEILAATSSMDPMPSTSFSLPCSA